MGGGAISIKQNGNVIGSMQPGTKDFQLCLDHDDVDIERDIFDLASTTNHGVCITSLSIDGTENSCTDDFVSTQKLKIQNNVVLSSECDKFCIKMTSSPDPYLCGQYHAYWSGDAISIKQNGNVIGSMEPGTKDFELCLDYDDVDIENDIFDLASTSDDGVCITSLSIDGTDILVGPNSKQPNFWFDGNE